MKFMVPLDGSRLAEEALSHALARLDPEDVLFLVRIYERDGFERKGDAAAYLSEVCRRLPGELNYRAVLREGRASRGLVQIALEEKVDLLVLCSQGRTGLQRWLVGSVAEDVVRHATCPTLLVKPGQSAVPTRSVMVPLDGSAIAERALLAALRLNPERLVLVLAANLPAVNLTPAMEERRGKRLQGFEKYLRSVAARHQDSHCRMTCVVEEGAAAASILRLAEEEPVDLIAMVRRVRASWPLGSVSEKVMRYAHVPVLLV